MKLEFLKIVYNYELRKSCFTEKETCQYCNKKFVSKYTLKKHFETSKCNNRLIRTPKIVESFITDIELDSILFRFIDEKINLISIEEYKLTSTLEKQKKRTKPSVLFDWFINYINKLLLKTRITKNGFYELLEKHNLELITEEENSYYLCNHIANQKKVNIENENDCNNDNDSKIDETISEEDNNYKLKVD